MDADSEDSPPAQGRTAGQQAAPSLRLDTRRAAREALDGALSQARQSVKIFDLDGAFWGFDRRDFGEAIGALLTREPASTVTLLLHDTRFVQRQCPRLMALLARRAARLRIMPTSPSIHGFRRGVAIVDDRIALRRPHFEQPLVFVDDDPLEAARSALLFADIEREALPGLSATTTGL